MNYQLESLAVILLAALAFAFSTRLFLKNKIRPSIALLLLASLFLKCFAAAPAYLHPWDERYHALVAKNMLADPVHPMLYAQTPLHYDPADWMTNHTWLHKPPLTLWLIAASLKTFGIFPFAVRIPSIFFSTLGILLTFAIARRLFDDRIAFFAALFHALCGILIAQAAGSFSTDHVDTMFVFFIELAVYFAVLHRATLQLRYVPLIGLAIGLALLTKWAAAMIVLPVWAILLWKRLPPWKYIGSAALMLFVAIAVAAPWQIYIRRVFPIEAQIESSYNWQHLAVAVEDHNQGFFYHFGKAYELFGILVYPGMLLAFLLFFRRRLPTPAGALIVWVALTYAVFTIAATKMGGYVLIAAPAVFILMALVLVHLQDAANQKPETRRWSSILFILAAIAAGVPIIQRFNILTPALPIKQWATDLHQIEAQFPPAPVVIFNDAHPIETMFDTPAIAYEKFPTPDNIETVRRAGYAIIILRRPSDPPTPLPNVTTLIAPPTLWDK